MPPEQDEPLGMLRRMVEIPSVTGAEGELAGYLVRQMRALGFCAFLDEAGNARGEIGDLNGPSVMLLGHVDTVPGQLPVRVYEGVLYGRGAVDAKGPLAAMLWAAARAGGGCGARVVVVGAVGEEGSSPGARHLLSGPSPDAVIIGEPSGACGVVLGYKGVLRLAIDVARPAAHTSTPAQKAVQVAAGYWQDVLEYLSGRYLSGKLFDRAIPALVELNGDTVRARAVISCRLPVGFDTPAFLRWLADRSNGDSVTVIEDVPAMRSARTDPVVRALSAAVRRQGREPVAKVKLGTSDMNVVGPAWSVPMAAYGPGDSRLDHSDDERIDLAEYLLAIDVLTDAIGALADAIRQP
jgi:LysW-gamma-L-lysine carboxypeptidase